jgi:hypothetical protein
MGCLARLEEVFLIVLSTTFILAESSPSKEIYVIIFSPFRNPHTCFNPEYYCQAPVFYRCGFISKSVNKHTLKENYYFSSFSDWIAKPNPNKGFTLDPNNCYIKGRSSSSTLAQST